MSLTDSFGKAAIKRERGDRHDERGNANAGYQQAIDETGERADAYREGDRQRQGKTEGSSMNIPA